MKPRGSVQRGVVSVAIVLAVAGTTLDALATSPAERKGLEGGIAAEFMWGPFATLEGPWFLVGGAGDYRFESWFHLRGKALLAIGHTSLYSNGIDDHASMTAGGVILRVLPSLDLGRYAVVRLGPAMAALLGDYESSVCGPDSYEDIAFGGSLELGARFGESSQFEIGAQADVIFVTPPRCDMINYWDDPPVYDNVPEDNVGLFLGGTFTFVFAK